MKPIEKDELFNHVSQFLKNKGIEFKEGSYAQGIQKSCGILTDAINLGQQGIRQAKAGIDKKLDQMRQVIHEKTAPKPPVIPPVTKPAPPKSQSSGRNRPTKASRGPKTRGPKGKPRRS
jgi:hypothetical protein